MRKQVQINFQILFFLFLFSFWTTSFSCSSCESEPGNIAKKAQPGEDGASCFNNSDCTGGRCIQELKFGYCASKCEEGCQGADAFCLKYLSGKSHCVDGCQSSLDCRDDYSCVSVTHDRRACLENKRGPRMGTLGARCEDHGCNQGLECVSLSDISFCVEACSECEDGVCREFEGQKSCMQKCEHWTQCALGLSCTSRACLPESKKEFSFDTTKKSLGIICAGDEHKVSDFTYEFEFQLQVGTKSFSLTSFVEQGVLKIDEIERDGKAFNLNTEYIHHNERFAELERFPELYGLYGDAVFDWTIIVPYAPQFSSFINSKSKYLVRVISKVSPPCLYILESSGEGRTLALNIYLASERVNTKNIADDRDLQEVFSRLKGYYSKVGIVINDMRFYDIDDEAKRSLNFSDIPSITSQGRPRDHTLQGHLSIDVFLVDSILGGAIGVSPGIPGSPGMHGNPKNGVVFSILDLGFDNDAVAYVMAHEIGHYLGLRHTTEIETSANKTLLDKVGREDPLSDTPVCLDFPGGKEACPDIGNLMFPSLLSKEVREGKLSPMQADALKANPLIR